MVSDGAFAAEPAGRLLLEIRDRPDTSTDIADLSSDRLLGEIVSDRVGLPARSDLGLCLPLARCAAGPQFCRPLANPVGSTNGTPPHRSPSRMPAVMLPLAPMAPMAPRGFTTGPTPTCPIWSSVRRLRPLGSST
jgi:hypothetical protein